jgi:hypothetical protein
MTGTMTWVGIDVHARSAHAAAIDAITGELRGCGSVQGSTRSRVAGSLPSPVRACYEAGPSGFGFDRAAVAAGIGMEVIASGKTPRELRPSTTERCSSVMGSAGVAARIPHPTTNPQLFVRQFTSCTTSRNRSIYSGGRWNGCVCVWAEAGRGRCGLLAKQCAGASPSRAGHRSRDDWDGRASRQSAEVAKARASRCLSSWRPLAWPCLRAGYRPGPHCHDNLWMTFTEWISEVEPAAEARSTARDDDARGLGRMLRDLHDELRPFDGELGGLRELGEDIERLLGQFRPGVAEESDAISSLHVTCFVRRAALSGTTSRTPFEDRSHWEDEQELAPFLDAQDVYDQIWRMYDRQRRRLWRPAPVERAPTSRARADSPPWTRNRFVATRKSRDARPP